MYRNKIWWLILNGRHELWMKFITQCKICCRSQEIEPNPDALKLFWTSYDITLLFQIVIKKKKICTVKEWCFWLNMLNCFILMSIYDGNAFISFRTVITRYPCVADNYTELSFEANQLITDGNARKCSFFFSFKIYIDY